MCKSSGEDVKIEIVFPEKYVAYNLKTMSKFAAAITHLCKAEAILGEDEFDFEIKGMTVMQVYTIEEAMEKFGIALTHSHKLGNTVFYADVTELRKILEGKE